MAANLEITCPCCESLLVVDRLTGEILLHKKKDPKVGLSLEAMVANLDSQKSELEKKFDKNMESQKDRARILEERFKEAMKKAESSDEKYVNPMDID
jgi:sulfate adenylyltransferase subunit 1 (EFTu-like GTPase family)